MSASSAIDVEALFVVRAGALALDGVSLRIAVGRVTGFRQAAGNRSAAQAPREAEEARLRAPAAEAAAQREQSERIHSRQREQLQTRRQKLRALAELRAGGATQLEAGTQLGVDERTIRRWTKLPGYEPALAKARARPSSIRTGSRRRAELCCSAADRELRTLIRDATKLFLD